MRQASTVSDLPPRLAESAHSVPTKTVDQVGGGGGHDGTDPRGRAAGHRGHVPDRRRRTPAALRGGLPARSGAQGRPRRLLGPARGRRPVARRRRAGAERPALRVRGDPRPPRLRPVHHRPAHRRPAGPGGGPRERPRRRDARGAVVRGRRPSPARPGTPSGLRPPRHPLLGRGRSARPSARRPRPASSPDSRRTVTTPGGRARGTPRTSRTSGRSPLPCLPRGTRLRSPVPSRPGSPTPRP